MGISRNGRAVAATSFYGLLALALGFLGALGGLIVYRMPILEACQSLWEALWVSRSAYGFWIPILVVGGSLTLIGTSLVQQWLATRYLLRGLTTQRVPPPPRLVRLAAESGLQGRIDCVAGVSVAPFCYGWLHPRVCIPVELLDLLDDRELAAVLRHEAHHVSHREPLKVWLSRGVTRGLFFLPLARDLHDTYLAAKEIAADEATAADGESELPLASALIKLLALRDQRVPDPMAAVGGLLSMPVALLAQNSGGNIAEARIRRLVDQQPVRLQWPPLSSVLLSALVVTAIFAVSYTSLAAAPAPLYGECVPQAVKRPPAPEPGVVEAMILPPPSAQPGLDATSLPVWEPVERRDAAGVHCDDRAQLSRSKWLTSDCQIRCPAEDFTLERGVAQASHADFLKYELRKSAWTCVPDTFHQSPAFTIGYR